MMEKIIRFTEVKMLRNGFTCMANSSLERVEDTELCFECNEELVEGEAYLDQDVIAYTLSTLCGKVYDSIYMDLTVSEECIKNLEKFTEAKILVNEIKENTIASKKEEMNQKILLNFSGGMDSLAVKYLLPPEQTELISVDFGGGFEREGNFFRKFEPHILKTNFRMHGYNRASITFMGTGSLLLASKLNAKYITFGTIFEAGPLGLREYNDKRLEKDIWEKEPFSFLELQEIQMVAGLTEVGTIKICTHFAPELINEALISLGSPGTEKRFRKQTLVDIVCKRTNRNIAYDKVEAPTEIERNSFGEIFALDFLCLYVIKHAGIEVASVTVADIPAEAVELANELSLDFYEKLNTNYINSIPYEIAPYYYARLAEAGVAVYNEKDWKEIEIVREFFCNYYPQIGMQNWHKYVELDDVAQDVRVEKSTGNYNYCFASVEKNREYKLTFDDVIAEEGDCNAVTLAVYSTTSKKVINKTIFEIASSENKSGYSWKFQIPDVEDDLLLLLYAGEAGQTSGIEVVYKNIKMESREFFCKYYSLIGLNNWYKYTELSDTVKDIRIEKVSGNNNHCFVPLEKNTEYKLTFEDVIVEEGDCNAVTLAVYNLTSKKVINKTVYELGSSENQNGYSWKFQIPDVEDDLLLLLYAGEAGQTSGIEVVYKNIKMESREFFCKYYSQIGMNNWYKYTELSDAVKDVRIKKGSGNNNYRFVPLEKNTEYKLTFDDVIVEEGDCNAVTLAVYNLTSKKVINKTVYELGSSENQNGYSWKFQISDVEDDLLLLLYAGEAGQTSGIEVVYKNIKMESREFFCKYYSQIGMNNWYKYTELSDAVKDVRVKKGSGNNNYRFVPLEKNTEYKLTFDDVIVEEGDCNAVTLAVYNLTSKKVINKTVYELGSSENQNGYSWKFQIPDVEDDLLLLLYAGEAGKTSGIEVVYKNIKVESKAFFCRYYSQIGMNNWHKYTELSDIVKDVRVKKGSGNYNYHFAPLKKNTEYTVTFDNVIVEEGECDAVSLAVYNITTKKVLQRTLFEITSDEKENGYAWEFVTPDVEDDLLLLLYAGTVGKTSGIEVTYKNIRMEIL